MKMKMNEYIVWYLMVIAPVFLIIYIIIYELKQR